MTCVKAMSPRAHHILESTARHSCQANSHGGGACHVPSLLPDCIRALASGPQERRMGAPATTVVHRQSCLHIRPSCAPALRPSGGRTHLDSIGDRPLRRTSAMPCGCSARRRTAHRQHDAEVVMRLGYRLHHSHGANRRKGAEHRSREAHCVRRDAFSQYLRHMACSRGDASPAVRTR